MPERLPLAPARNDDGKRGSTGLVAPWKVARLFSSTLRRYFTIVLALLGAHTFLSAAQGAEERQYADWLFSTGRYDEAISQYHRAAFFAPNEAGRLDAFRGGLRSRLRAGKSLELLEETRALSADERCRLDPLFMADCGLAVARAHLLRREWSNAALIAGPLARESTLDATRRDHALVLQAVATVWQSEPRALSKSLGGLSAPEGDSPFVHAWETWRQGVPRDPKIPVSSPVLSALCACVLPGSGHWVNGYGLDGLQAFLIDGALIVMTALLLKEDLSKAPDAPGRFALTLPVGLVTLFVHGANVAGAVRASQRRNEMAKYRFRLNLAAGLDSLAAKFSLDL